MRTTNLRSSKPLRSFVVALATTVLGIALLGAPAEGSTRQSGMAVAATVNVMCQVNTNWNLVFGNYSGAQIDADANVHIHCTKPIAVFLQLNRGLNSGVTRRMANGAARLNYDLYTDAARTTVWDANPGQLISEPIRQDRDNPIYGRLFANQNPLGGAYSDTIVATILY